MTYQKGASPQSEMVRTPCILFLWQDVVMYSLTTGGRRKVYETVIENVTQHDCSKLVLF